MTKNAQGDWHSKFPKKQEPQNFLPSQLLAGSFGGFGLVCPQKVGFVGMRKVDTIDKETCVGCKLDENRMLVFKLGLVPR